MITRSNGTLAEQVFLKVQLVIGSKRVEVLTGRRAKDGSPEVLLTAIGTSDRNVIRKLKAFLDHAIAERQIHG
jgi:hypothetical protein